MVQEEGQFGEEALTTKISNLDMSLSVYPWQTLARTQMEVNSSSPLQKQVGLMEDMLFSGK